MIVITVIVSVTFVTQMQKSFNTAIHPIRDL